MSNRRRHSALGQISPVAFEHPLNTGDRTGRFSSLTIKRSGVQNGGMADDAGDGNGGIPGPSGETGGQASGGADGRSWTERALVPPGPDSPFYVPPPSIKALRWSIVILLVTPTVLAFATLLAAFDRNWTAATIAGVLLCVFGVLRAYQLRAVMHEVAKRHAEEVETAGNPESRLKRSTDEDERGAP